jgi:hypothetical protein
VYVRVEAGLRRDVSCWRDRGGSRRWGRRVQILGNRAAADAQMPRDFAPRPFLYPVEAVNFVDLIRGEHLRSPLYRRSGGRTRTMFFSRSGRTCGSRHKWLKDQELRGSQVVLFKIFVRGSQEPNLGAECFRSRAKLFFTRCCTRRLRSRCRWFSGSVRRRRSGCASNSSGNRDARPATSAGYRGPVMRKNLVHGLQSQNVTFVTRHLPIC